MPIVCLLESEAGSRVSMVSALLAARMKTRLHLAQSTDEPVRSAAHRARAAWMGARLAQRAERARTLTRLVGTHVLPAPAEREVGALAQQLNAELIVRAADDGRSDLLAQHVQVPVLTVRDEAPFVRWASELSPLRVVGALAGADDTPSVLRMIRRLTEVAPCQVSLVHVASDEPVLARDHLGAIVRQEGVSSSWELCVEPRHGPRAQQLIAMASARRADVVVTGSRVMGRVSRLWQRSVSRQVVADATCSVLCVPVLAPRARGPRPSMIYGTPGSRHARC